MIEVKNIHKGFDGKTVIDDVTATFETGKCNLIIGQRRQNRMMKCIVGLFEPDSGDILEQNFTTMISKTNP
jgi:phospholipid/cholesterol/gamma-HCH transport system ATP-binding protein